MRFEVLPTRYDTWIVVNRDDGVICGEFIDQWAADDLAEQMDIQDEEWDYIDGCEDNYDGLED